MTEMFNTENPDFKYLQLPKFLENIKRTKNRPLDDNQIEHIENILFPLPPDFKEFIKYFNHSWFGAEERNPSPLFMLKNRANCKLTLGLFTSAGDFLKDAERLNKIANEEGYPKDKITFGSGNEYMEQLSINDKGEIWFENIMQTEDDGTKGAKVGNSINEFLANLQEPAEFLITYSQEYPEKKKEIKWIEYLIDLDKKRLKKYGTKNND